MEIDLVSESSCDSLPPMLETSISLGCTKQVYPTEIKLSDDDNEPKKHNFSDYNYDNDFPIDEPTFETSHPLEVLELSSNEEPISENNFSDDDCHDNLNAAVYCLSDNSSNGEIDSEKFVDNLPQTTDVLSPIIRTKRRKLTQEEKGKKLADLEIKKQRKAQQQEEKKRKQEAKEEEKRLRNEAKTQKQVEKEREKLLKKIECESNRNLKPDQSIKFVKVVIDSNLMQLKIGPLLVPLLESAEIQYEVQKQMLPNCITWKRDIIESSLSQELEIEVDKNEKDENEILIYLPLEEFLKYVNGYKENREKDNLLSHAKSVKRYYPKKKITYIVEGYDRYSKTQKNSAQRKFRGTVLESTETASKSRKKTKSNVSVTDLDVEECIVEVLTEAACTTHLVDSSADVASIIISYTKAIAAAPYKQAKYQSQLLLQTTSDNYKGVKVKDSGEGLLSLWQKQIETFNLVTADVAQAITNKYSSPSALVRAYGECLCNKEKEKLLQDIMIRRGVGPLANTRRIGPELSRKLFLLFTSKNPDLNLHLS